MAAATSASAWSCCASCCRCFGSDPELAPIRIGIPPRFAAVTTCSTLSGPPMLPGLIRTAATPASIARSARLALKWMSAITGSGESRTIALRACASASFGTAQRTTSQPAEASAAICAVVAATSCVGVSVIDWTTTGAPPPIGTFPTLIVRSLATERMLAALHGDDRCGFGRREDLRREQVRMPEEPIAHRIGPRETGGHVVLEQQASRLHQVERPLAVWLLLPVAAVEEEELERA